LVAIIAAVAATIAKQAAATNDVLLAALAWALSRWTGRTTVSVDLEGHGREEILDGVDLLPNCRMVYDDLPGRA